MAPLPDPLVTSDVKRLGGTPVFAGTRVPVRLLFEYLATGSSLDEFLHQYPDVTKIHAAAVIAEAARHVQHAATTAAA